MKTFFFAVSLFIAFSATAQPESSPVKWLTHTDSLHNLTIEYPSDWQLKPPTERARFFITSYAESDKDKFRDNLNCIAPKPLEKSITIQMAETDITKSLSENLPDFKIINSGYSQWNNVNAYEIEYSCTQNSGKDVYSLHILQKVAIIDAKLYALTFTSEDEFYKKNIGTVRKMIESFKVK
jgi:hypothetical protein